MKEIKIPEKLEPIIEAFCAHSPKTAKALILQAAKTIYGSDDDADECETLFRREHDITPDELDDICVMMQELRPTDMLEALSAAQILVTHLLGLRKLAKCHIDDQRMGLQLLKFSSVSMALLHRKRTGSLQNIVVNYNNTGHALTQITNPRGIHAH